MAVCIMAPVGGKGKGKKKPKSKLLFITQLLSAAKELNFVQASIIKGGKGAVSNLWAYVIPKITKNPPPPPLYLSYVLDSVIILS